MYEEPRRNVRWFDPCAQVDLASPKRVTGIITQGAKDFGTVQFVTAFKVSYSNDGRSWTVVKDKTTNTDTVCGVC